MYFTEKITSIFSKSKEVLAKIEKGYLDFITSITTCMCFI